MAGHIPDSLSVDWCTEDKYVECVHKTFGGPPDLDPCSNPHSRVGARRQYMLPYHDGLVEDWDGGSGFMNPPFGKGWWKLRGCENKVCACSGDCKKRDYIWPADRAAKLKQFEEQAGQELDLEPWQDKVKKLAETKFKAWAKDYTLVDIGDWIALAAAYGPVMEQGVIGLLPSYPGTKAWQEHVFPKARRIFFPKGRLHFRLVYTLDDGRTIEKTGPAPMDCAFPLWTNNLYMVHEFEKAFGPHGRIVTP